MIGFSQAATPARGELWMLSADKKNVIASSPVFRRAHRFRNVDICIAGDERLLDVAQLIQVECESCKPVQPVGLMIRMNMFHISSPFFEAGCLRSINVAAMGLDEGMVCSQGTMER